MKSSPVFAPIERKNGENFTCFWTLRREAKRDSVRDWARTKEGPNEKRDEEDNEEQQNNLAQFPRQILSRDNVFYLI